MSRALVLLVALSLLQHLPGCKKKDKSPPASRDSGPVEVSGEDAGSAQAVVRAPERVVLARVVAKTVDPKQPRELHPRLLAQAIGKQLTDSEWFYSPGDTVPAKFRVRLGELQVLITYDVMRDPKTKQRSVMVAVEAEVVWAKEGEALPLRDKVLFERTLEPGSHEDLDGLMATQAALAVEAAGEGLLAKEEVRAGPDASVAKVLENPEQNPELTLWALEVVRSQKRSALFDDVVALLDAKNPDVRETAVGVLLALGDPRAVPYLTEKAEMGDRLHLFAVIEAVSTLGGEEAVDFLEFLASGHPDAEVRQRAKDGLERLERAPPR